MTSSHGYHHKHVYKRNTHLLCRDAVDASPSQGRAHGGEGETHNVHQIPDQQDHHDYIRVHVGRYLPGGLLASAVGRGLWNNQSTNYQLYRSIMGITCSTKGNMCGDGNHHQHRSLPLPHLCLLRRDPTLVSASFTTLVTALLDLPSDHHERQVMRSRHKALMSCQRCGSQQRQHCGLPSRRLARLVTSQTCCCWLLWRLACCLNL